MCTSVSEAELAEAVKEAKKLELEGVKGEASLLVGLLLLIFNMPSF